MQEVIDLEPDHTEPTARIGNTRYTEFIRGMGKHNDKFIIILDIDKVFSAEGIAMTQAMPREPATA